MARYALVIGITQYDNFRKLPKAATDAEAIASLLEQHYYNVTRLPNTLVGENQWAIASDKGLTSAKLVEVNKQGSHSGSMVTEN